MSIANLLGVGCRGLERSVPLLWKELCGGGENIVGNTSFCWVLILCGVLHIKGELSVWRGCVLLSRRMIDWGGEG